MNDRLLRRLLWLYPRRVRDRYGDELLDLHHELERRDGAARVRIVAASWPARSP